MPSVNVPSQLLETPWSVLACSLMAASVRVIVDDLHDLHDLHDLLDVEPFNSALPRAGAVTAFALCGLPELVSVHRQRRAFHARVDARGLHFGPCRT